MKICPHTFYLINAVSCLTYLHLWSTQSFQTSATELLSAPDIFLLFKIIEDCSHHQATRKSTKFGVSCGSLRKFEWSQAVKYHRGGAHVQYPVG